MGLPDPVFQDGSCLVVDKPSGLLAVPGRLEEHKDSLSLRLQESQGDVFTIHRLDMDTSGLMVFARTHDAQRALSRQFEARTVQKRYVALVSGDVAENDGIIDFPLAADWPNRPLQKVDETTGKPSRTCWQVISRQARQSRLSLTPETGRTHQLRVHLAAIGHPILGDAFYAAPDARAASERLCLHASGLAFDHPETGERLTFESPPPF